MIQFKDFAGAAAAAALVACAAPVGAVATSTSTPTSDTLTINLPNYAVTDISIIDDGSPFLVLNDNPTHPYTAATPGPTTLTEDFLTAAEVGFPGFVYSPGPTFLVGVTSGLPGDAPGQQHLVLFTNNSFAAHAQSIAFGALFPNTNETAIINELEDPASNPNNTFAFASGDAMSGPSGSIYFTPGDSFTAIAFSDGLIIGTGTSHLVASVPEPATWAMMLVGFGGLGAAMRARRRATVTA